MTLLSFSLRSSKIKIIFSPNPRNKRDKHKNQCGNVSHFSIIISDSFGAILKYPFQINLNLNHGLNMAVNLK